MARPIAFILMSALISVLPLAGCASTDGASTAPATALTELTISSMPDDWSLDATVLAGRDVSDQAPAHLRASRYTVFPDGSLHYADADEDPYRRGSAWLPLRTRMLPASELIGVWALARDLGFTDSTAGEPPRNVELVRPPSDGLAIIITVAGDEVRRMFISRSDDAELDDDAARLVRHLAALAWADDRRRDPAPIQPTRYDLGSDPYARYRNQ